jgi:diguanylate cyclase (GGDEF)-like protein
MLLVNNIFQLETHGMTNIWKNRTAKLDYAFQPIVNSYTGDVFGYEALLRNWDQCGFNSIFGLFDSAFEDKVLYALDLELRRKAIEKFRTIPGMESRTLFYNLDNRVLEMPDYIPGNTTGLLRELGIQKSSLYFEISERHEFDSLVSASNILEGYKNQNFRIAIDDYGSGYSGLQLLYHSNPDVLKIDRFFIEGIHDDPKKKLFAENIVNMAHLMGIKVVAEGIENCREMHFCRTIGCDLLQGFRIARPEQNIRNLRPSYPLENKHTPFGRRKGEGPSVILEGKLKKIYPITMEAESEEILKRFQREDLRLLPVVDHLNQPIGCIQEEGLKNYVYSPYGIALFKNRTHTKGLESFVSRIPITEETKSLDSILKIAATVTGANGIVITSRGKYLGILEPAGLLDLINEQELANARDQNPLTRLPGNFKINNKLVQLLKNPNAESTVVYFDFNHFKPYNDKYGFRWGDRAIILFAEILKKELNLQEDFLGHVGGDDFLVILNGTLEQQDGILKKVQFIQETFAASIQSCYNQEDRAKGYIRTKDRSGEYRNHPLLTVSAAVMEIRKSGRIPLEEFTQRITSLKQKAKSSPDFLAFAEYKYWKNPLIPAFG